MAAADSSSCRYVPNRRVDSDALGYDATESGGLATGRRMIHGNRRTTFLVHPLIC